MEEASVALADLSLDAHKSFCAEPTKEEEGLVPFTPVESGKKRKKKKKSSSGVNTSKCSLHHSALPSQPLLQSRFPWKIVTKPKRGRCVISTREIKAGELVVSEQALAFVLRSSFRKAACHNCCRDFSETSTAVPCEACNCVLFCEQCGQAAVALHDKWCSILKDIYTIAGQADCDGDLLRLVLALALRRDSSVVEQNEVPFHESVLENGAGVSKDGVIQPSFQDALALQTHREKISGAWKASVRKGCEALRDSMLKHNVCLESSVEDLEFLAALVNANAHGMGAQGLHNTDVAIGIFPFVSMLNHSCRPNCCFFSEGNVMHVRANQDILQDTEMCLSYINLYESRATRRSQLALTKHFDCRCSRCVEPLSSSVDRFLEGVLCNIKGCGGVVVRKTQEIQNNASADDDQHLVLWQCDSCSGVLDPALNSPQNSRLSERPWDLVALAQEKLHAALLVYNERRFKDARILIEDFVTEFSGKLHPLHVLLFDALTPLMNCCRVLGDAEGGVKVCRNIVSCLGKLLNGPSLELANFYFCLAEMCSECADAANISPVLAKRYKKQGQEALQQARHIRRICFGRSSLS